MSPSLPNAAMAIHPALSAHASQGAHAGRGGASAAAHATKSAGVADGAADGGGDAFSAMLEALSDGAPAATAAQPAALAAGGAAAEPPEGKDPSAAPAAAAPQGLPAWFLQLHAGSVAAQLPARAEGLPAATLPPGAQVSALATGKPSGDKATAASTPSAVGPKDDFAGVMAAAGTPPATAHPSAVTALASEAAASSALEAAPGKAREPSADAGALTGLLPAAPQVQVPADPSPASPVHQAALPSQPLDAAFAGDLAAQVRVMVDQGIDHAELHLNPTDLGPIRIELSVNAQTADIHFVAAHDTTRDGISQSLPALREMLAGQGLALGQAGVSPGSQQQQQQAEAREGAARARRATGPGDGSRSLGGIEGASQRRTIAQGRGLLDLYA